MTKIDQKKLYDDIKKTYDWTVNVCIKQERLLDGETMYQAYRSMHFRPEMTKTGFLKLYLEIIKALREISSQDKGRAK